MEYVEPLSVDEALGALARHGPNARVIAGGTDVMVDMRYKEEPACLVNITRIPGLANIRETSSGLGIGPLVTIRELETSDLVRQRLPLLWDATRQFASLQVRNAATIGGNICRASPSGETLAPLLALEAQVKFAFPGAERVERIGSFLQGPGKTALGSTGLLTEILIPSPPQGSQGMYLKHAVRGAMDIAMVGVAILITTNGLNSPLRDVRIGLGAVAPTPIRAARAESLVRGNPFTAALAQEAGRVAASESRPITDQRASAEYRTWIVAALTSRGLEKSWLGATGSDVLE